MIPIMREPTGLIIIPLRTELPPPAAVAAAAEALRALGSPSSFPQLQKSRNLRSRPLASCLEIYFLEFRTQLSPQLRHIRAICPFSLKYFSPAAPSPNNKDFSVYVVLFLCVLGTTGSTL